MRYGMRVRAMPRQGACMRLFCAMAGLCLWTAPGHAADIAHGRQAVQMEDGIAYSVEISAPDAAQPEEGDTVILAFTATTNDGSIVGEASATAPCTIAIPLPARRWLAAITKMHVGEQWLIRVPAAYASGVPIRTPGNSDLIVRTRLIDVRKHRPGPDDLIG